MQSVGNQKRSSKLETWGSEETMNLNNLIYQNVITSPYFKTLYEKRTYHEVVDEIYNQVGDLSPFLKGTTVSSAFCLLFKLWTLRLTMKQIRGLIDHYDSPYIRALGFLYLRYVCKPSNLWEWFEPYFDDEEEIQMQGGVRPVMSTIGRLCQDLLMEQKFLGTMLPRIPVPIMREINDKMKERNREFERPQEQERHSRRYKSRSRSRSRSPGRYQRRRNYSQSPRRRRDRSREYRSRYHSHHDRRKSRSRSPYRERSRSERKPSESINYEDYEKTKEPVKKRLEDLKKLYGDASTPIPQKPNM